MSSMKRREFILAFGGAVASPFAAGAQQESLALIGFLNAGAATTLKREIDAFRDGLRKLEHIEGRDVRLEYRFADGELEKVPVLAAELVRLNPHVIVSAPVPANLAIAKATSSIPIVTASGGDPVGFGLVKSLSHPGGNVTGLTNFAEELASKQIDLMRELLPGLARLAALVNVANPLHVPQWRETQAAATQAAIALVPFELRSADQLEEAFAKFSRERADALLIPPDVTFTTHRRRIANLALGARLPTTFFIRQSTEDGGLMSYGPNPVENYRRAATYVDKILKGAMPGDLRLSGQPKSSSSSTSKPPKRLASKSPRPCSPAPTR
jgi:putative ABC transport system substrate-binding protein